jgi:hypothetical protein
MTLLNIDHVLLGTTDLEGTARALSSRHGLISYEGGRHTGLGTGNRIVPLGDCYLEIIGVVDEAEAKTNVFGRWLASQVAAGPRLVGWCLATDDIDRVAARIGVDAVPMRRVLPDGRILSWRLAGLEVAMGEPPLPFFISWEIDAELHPGRAGIAHRQGPVRLTGIEVGGDKSRLGEWIAGEPLPVTTVDDAPAVRAVLLAGPDGPIRIGE